MNGDVSGSFVLNGNNPFWVLRQGSPEDSEPRELSEHQKLLLQMSLLEQEPGVKFCWTLISPGTYRTLSDTKTGKIISQIFATISWITLMFLSMFPGHADIWDSNTQEQSMASFFKTLFFYFDHENPYLYVATAPFIIQLFIFVVSILVIYIFYYVFKRGFLNNMALKIVLVAYESLVPFFMILTLTTFTSTIILEATTDEHTTTYYYITTVMCILSFFVLTLSLLRQVGSHLIIDLPLCNSRPQICIRYLFNQIILIVAISVFIYSSKKYNSLYIWVTACIILLSLVNAYYAIFRPFFFFCISRFMAIAIPVATVINTFVVAFRIKHEQATICILVTDAFALLVALVIYLIYTRSAKYLTSNPSNMLRLFTFASDETLLNIINNEELHELPEEDTDLMVILIRFKIKHNLDLEDCFKKTLTLLTQSLHKYFTMFHLAIIVDEYDRLCMSSHELLTHKEQEFAFYVSGALNSLIEFYSAVLLKDPSTISRKVFLYNRRVIEFEELISHIDKETFRNDCRWNYYTFFLRNISVNLEMLEGRSTGVLLGTTEEEEIDERLLTISKNANGIDFYGQLTRNNMLKWIGSIAIIVPALILIMIWVMCIITALGYNDVQSFTNGISRITSLSRNLLENRSAPFINGNSIFIDQVEDLENIQVKIQDCRAYFRRHSQMFKSETYERVLKAHYDFTSLYSVSLVSMTSSDIFKETTQSMRVLFTEIGSTIQSSVDKSEKMKSKFDLVNKVMLGLAAFFYLVYFVWLAITLPALVKDVGSFIQQLGYLKENEVAEQLENCKLSAAQLPKPLRKESGWRFDAFIVVISIICGLIHAIGVFALITGWIYTSQTVFDSAVYSYGTVYLRYHFNLFCYNSFDVTYHVPQEDVVEMIGCQKQITSALISAANLDTSSSSCNSYPIDIVLKLGQLTISEVLNLKYSTLGTEKITYRLLIYLADRSIGFQPSDLFSLLAQNYQRIPSFEAILNLFSNLSASICIVCSVLTIIVIIFVGFSVSHIITTSQRFDHLSRLLLRVLTVQVPSSPFYNKDTLEIVIPDVYPESPLHEVLDLMPIAVNTYSKKGARLYKNQYATDNCTSDELPATEMIQDIDNEGHIRYFSTFISKMSNFPYYPYDKPLPGNKYSVCHDVTKIVQYNAAIHIKTREMMSYAHSVLPDTFTVGKGNFRLFENYAIIDIVIDCELTQDELQKIYDQILQFADQFETFYNVSYMRSSLSIVFCSSSPGIHCFLVHEAEQCLHYICVLLNKYRLSDLSKIAVTGDRLLIVYINPTDEGKGMIFSKSFYVSTFLLMNVQIGDVVMEIRERDHQGAQYYPDIDQEEMNLEIGTIRFVKSRIEKVAHQLISLPM